MEKQWNYRQRNGKVTVQKSRYVHEERRVDEQRVVVVFLCQTQGVDDGLPTKTVVTPLLDNRVHQCLQ